MTTTVRSDRRAWRTLSDRQWSGLRDDAEFVFLGTPPRGQVLEVRSADGTRLHTEVFGPADGYPIVLSHGICCALRFWDYQIADLSPDFRVIAFDHRGHGRSDRPARGGYTTARLAEDLDAVLRTALRPGERAVIAGHSMGGITIQAWADRFPAQVGRFADAVALLNTTAGELVGFGGGPNPSALSTVANRVLTAGALVFGGIPLPARLPLRAALMDPGTVGRDATPAVRAMVRELILDTPSSTRGAFIRSLAVLRTGDLDAGSLTVPALVIGSQFDHLLPYAHSRRLEASLPNSLGLVKVPGGHCSPLEHPGQISGALRNLANNARRTSSTA
ncbi:alpha/beta fold hydrolase [Nocardia sp. NBC_00511]|uniref:alpha/beta fold hydrolase n=1 Tax=Nocardia sp. NBC_00511 TaxID=2903591 RepID=UPI0030E4BB18